MLAEKVTKEHKDCINLLPLSCYWSKHSRFGEVLVGTTLPRFENSIQSFLEFSVISKKSIMWWSMWFYIVRVCKTHSMSMRSFQMHHLTLMTDMLKVIVMAGCKTSVLQERLVLRSTFLYLLRRIPTSAVNKPPITAPVLILSFNDGKHLIYSARQFAATGCLMSFDDLVQTAGRVFFV